MTGLLEDAEEIAARRALAQHAFSELPLPAQEGLLQAVDGSPQIALALQDGRWVELVKLLKDGSSSEGHSTWESLAFTVERHIPHGLED